MDLNTLTQQELQLLDAALKGLAHLDAIAQVRRKIRIAQKCSGDVAIVGAASYRELEACLDEPASSVGPVRGDAPRPFAYRIEHDGSGTVYGPFMDLHALRNDMRERRLTDEMVSVGHWPTQALELVR